VESGYTAEWEWGSESEAPAAVAATTANQIVVISLKPNLPNANRLMGKNVPLIWSVYPISSPIFPPPRSHQRPQCRFPFLKPLVQSCANIYASK